MKDFRYSAHARPALMPVTTHGKLIDTVRGFSTAINWVFSALFNLRFTGGVKVTDWDKGVPTVELDLLMEGGEDTNAELTEEDNPQTGRRTYYLNVYYK